MCYIVSLALFFPVSLFFFVCWSSSIITILLLIDQSRLSHFEVQRINFFPHNMHSYTDRILLKDHIQVIVLWRYIVTQKTECSMSWIEMFVLHFLSCISWITYGYLDTFEIMANAFVIIWSISQQDPRSRAGITSSVVELRRVVFQQT